MIMPVLARPDQFLIELRPTAAETERWRMPANRGQRLALRRHDAAAELLALHAALERTGDRVKRSGLYKAIAYVVSAIQELEVRS